MEMIKLKITPPKEWYHDPNIRDEDRNTVAMMLI